jgi:hypothetical protein
LNGKSWLGLVVEEAAEGRKKEKEGGREGK